jgi:hypothetical protein
MKQLRKDLQRDADYVKDMRWRLDRANDRINSLILINEQLRRTNKLLDESFESLNQKYLLLIAEKGKRP